MREKRIWNLPFQTHGRTNQLPLGPDRPLQIDLLELAESDSNTRQGQNTQFTQGHKAETASNGHALNRHEES